MTTGTYAYSFDDEFFQGNFHTREDAVAACIAHAREVGELSPGDSFTTGRADAAPHARSFAPDIDDILEHMANKAPDDYDADNWPEFVAALDADTSRTKLRNIHESALWARSKITYALDYRIEGVHRVYVGHTPVKAPVTLGNVVYIDTGAVFGKEMTVVEINAEMALKVAA